MLTVQCPPQQTLRRALNEDEDLDLEAEFEIEAAEFEIRDEWILAIGLLFDTDSAVIRRAMLSTGMGTPRMIFFTSPAQVRILASLKTPLALGSVHTIMRTELGAVLHVSTYSNLLSKNTIVACAVVERADEAHYSAFFEEVLKYTDNKLTVPSRARANADEVDALSVAQQESAPGIYIYMHCQYIVCLHACRLQLMRTHSIDTNIAAQYLGYVRPSSMCTCARVRTYIGATSSQLPSSASHSSTPDHEVHLSRIPSTIPSLCWSAPLSAAQLSSRPSPSPPSQPSSSQVSSANNNVSSFPSLSSFCTTATTASCSASSLNLLSTATVPAANVLSAPPQSLPTSCATPAVSASVPTISSSASSSVAASPCSSSSSSSDSCSSSSSQNSARSNSTESSQLVLLQQYLPSMAIATLEPTESNVGEVWYALQWRGVTVDFSEAQINAVTASLNHAIRESNPSVPLDTVWCVVEQSVRGSCRLHYQQSCQRLLRSGVVVPAKMVVSVGARLRKITQVGTLTEVDEIISSLVRDCPAILPFLNWWTRARIARLLFRATAAAAIEGQSAASRTFSLPPTNNVAKSMGRSLQLSAHKLPLNLEETIGLLERETRYIEAQLLAIENNVLPHRKGKKRKKPVAPISD